MNNHDDDRRRILERRARYVAMALAGLGTATQAACAPCLAPPDAFTHMPDEGVSEDAASRDSGPAPSDAGTNDAPASTDASLDDTSSLEDDAAP